MLLLDHFFVGIDYLGVFNHLGHRGKLLGLSAIQFFAFFFPILDLFFYNEVINTFCT